jgi:hypothetical protein
METDDRMILRDLPVDTRNYTIVDNITGKPIDQSNYTLTIDTEVIKKLNTLKLMNEEKVKQAALRDKYGSTSLVSTFTPEDNAVFTPEYNDEYISYHDFNSSNVEEKEEVVEETMQPEEEKAELPHAEVIQSDTLLDRVVARDPSVRLAEKEEQEKAEQPKEELDYISNYDPNKEYVAEAETTEEEIKADNSLFTPEMATLQQASEQIVKINEDKLGEDIKPIPERKRLKEKIKLDKMEVISGRGIAWMAYILFFIPLLFKRKNRFVRIHANEGLDLNIVEIISALLIGQYYLLPNWVTLEGMGITASLFGCMIGAGIAAACALTIVIRIICSLAGNYSQIHWLWKQRIIKVQSERSTED